MKSRTTPLTAVRRTIAVAVVGLLLLLGPGAPAGATVPLKSSAAAVPTTSTISLTAAQYTYGHKTRAWVTVRDPAGHVPKGTVRFALDGRVFASSGFDSRGRATAIIGTTTPVGRHSVTGTFVPAANAGVTGSSAGTALNVLRANVNWTWVVVPSYQVYGGNVSISVQLKGVVRVTGRVSLVRGGKVLQSQAIASDGSANFSVPALWPAGRRLLIVSYSGNATFAPASVPLVVQTSRAPSSLRVSMPSTLAYALGATAAVSVSGVGAVPGGRVSLSVDGRTKSIKTLSNGRATLALPAMSGGSHRVTVNYSGDVNHSAAGRSTVVTAAYNECPVTARACVDLTHSLTWLQSGGQVSYGPVPMASGRPGYRTSAGTFSVFWKDIDHHSSEFNNAPMPYSVFFDGGIAFHEGSIYVESHGCIHLTRSAAQFYFSNLHVGDRVVVFGRAPY